MRFMTMVMAAENQGDPPQGLMEAMGPFIEEASKNGSLVHTGGLAAMADSTQVRLYGGNISVVDGPFSEAKEVIGGYAILDLESKEAAIQVGKDFLELHRKHWPGWQGRSEIRQIFGPEE